MAAGDLAGDAARRRAVVHIDQPALGGFAQHRRQRLLGRGEARAHVARDPDIALEPAHQPMQAVDVLLGRERGKQRLRAGIVVGIIERLHRNLQQHFVIFSTRALRQLFEIGAVGRQRECHRRRQFGERIGGAGGADAEPADHDGDARRVFFVWRQLARMRIERRWAYAIRSDLRDRTMPCGFQQFLVERRFRRSPARIAGNDHLLALAARAIDDGDRLAAGRWGYRLGCRGGRCRRIGRRAGRAVVAGMLLAVAVAVLLGLARRRRLGGDHRYRLAAQRIIDEDRPGHDQQAKQTKHAGQQLWRGNR